MIDSEHMFVMQWESEQMFEVSERLGRAESGQGERGRTMTLAWDLECRVDRPRPRLQLLSDPPAPVRRGSGPRRRQRLVGAVMALIVVVSLALLALPIRSLGGSTLAQAAPAAGQEYVVKAGDTLGSIAYRADPSHAAGLVARLAAETGTPVVVPGERIFIP